MALSLMLSALISISVLVVFAGIMLLRPSGDLWQRVEVYENAARGSGRPATLEEIELQQSFIQRALKPALLQVMWVLGSVMPIRRLSKARARLLLAGEPGGLTAVQFVGLQVLSTIVLGGLSVLRVYAGPKLPPMMVVALTLFVVIGFKLPDIWLTRRIQRRQRQLTNQLPDGLDMLAIGVEAGLSFDQALGEIVARQHNELSREFRRVLYEMGVGTSRREALLHLQERTGVPDITSFVVALNNSEDLGTSIGQVLNVQSQEMRTRRRQRAQEKANKVPVKMMFPLVFFIFPSMFAVILGPAIPRISRLFASINK